MERLKYTEAMQNINDLRQQIAQLELKKAEKWTQNQLRGTSVCDVDDDSVSFPLLPCLKHKLFRIHMPQSVRMEMLSHWHQRI